MITVNGDGSSQVDLDPSVGPYDGSDDMTVGVQNGSARSLSDLVVSGARDLFGFDSDGLCTFIACSWNAPTGYEGPLTQFVPDPSTSSSGTIHFTSLIPGGGSTYFSLEGAPSATAVATVAPGTVVHPAPSIDPSYWSPGHGHAAPTATTGPVANQPTAGTGVPASSGPTKHGTKQRDPCIAALGNGTIKHTSGGRTIHDRIESLYQVCEGFGAPEGFHIEFTTGLKCAIASAVVSVKSDAASTALDLACTAEDIRAHPKDVTTYIGATCSFAGDLLGARVGKPKVGNVIGILCAGAPAVGTGFGTKLESDHEFAVARDIVQNGECLEFRHYLGVDSVHAVDCSKASRRR